MKDLSTKAVVTGPGGFYYREEHEWRGLGGDAGNWFAKAQDQMVQHITKAQQHSKKDGQLTATLDATIDGVAQPQVVISNVNRQEMHAVQRLWHKLEDEILSFGEKSGKK